MAIVYPNGLDNFTNPVPANRLSTPGVLHTDQHSNANDAIEALEHKVGVDGSSDPNSLDYKVAHVTSGSGAPFQTDLPANVGASAITGTSGSVPHADHVHQGVHGLFTPPEAVLTGDVALVAGTNISITQTSGSLTITNTMGAGGITFDPTSPQDVGASPVVGTSGSPSHGDHAHRGVHGLFASPNDSQFGDIELVGQNGMTITQSSGSFAFNQDLSGYVPTSRTVSTTSPLFGGGDLSVDRTIAITQSGAASDGYLSSADWNAFNAKPSGLTPFETDAPADVGLLPVTGTSGSVPHSDHVHRGVHGLFTGPSAAQFGDIALEGSGDISVVQSSGSFTIGATSGSFLPKVHDINGQYHDGFPLRVDNGGLGTIQPPTAGAIPVGTSEGVYAPNHLVAGTNIAITNTSGSVTITNTMAVGGITFDTAAPQDVGGSASVGTSGSPPHSDHVHRGVHGVFVAPNANAYGDIELVGSSNISVTQSSGSFTIATSGSFLPQIHDINGQYHSGFPLTPDHGGTGVDNGANQLTIPATGTAVLTARAINTTSPLNGGGDLSTDRTLTIDQASHTTDGYLSAEDWTAFDSKQSNLTPFQTDAPADIGGSAITGTSGSVPHADHMHRGVTGVLTPPNAAAYGMLELLGSGNVTVTQSSGSFTVATSGSFLPQVHDINGAYHDGFPLRTDNGGLGTIVAPNAGAIPIGKTDGTYAPNHLIAGTNISITNTSGSVTITNTMAAGGITFDPANPQDVGNSAVVGTSGSPSHGDHVHRGVHGLFTTPNASQFGDIALQGSGDITVSQSSGSFTIGATSGSFLPQVHDINGSYHTNFPLRTDKGGLSTLVIPTAGAIPIGKSDGTYAPNHITAGSNITITNTSGSLTINAPTGAPGGSNTSVQYNDSGVFGGDTNLLWDKDNFILGVNSGSTTSNIVSDGILAIYSEMDEMPVVILNSSYIGIGYNNVNGASIELRSEGNGNNLLLTAGSASIVDTNGGDVVLRVGDGNGTGLRGNVIFDTYTDGVLYTDGATVVALPDAEGFLHNDGAGALDWRVEQDPSFIKSFLFMGG